MKKILLLTLLVMTGFYLQAQTSEDALKEYFLDAEYFLAQEEYIDALYDYMELYKNGYENNANINYRIGICYVNIPGQKDKAIPYLLEAVKNIKENTRDSKYKEKEAPMDAWLYLGIAYRINDMLNKAIEAYEHYKSILPPKDDVALQYVNNEIQACKSAQEFMKKPVNIKRINLGEPVNSSSSNFKAVLSGDGSTLLYMNELPFYNAVYYSKFQDGNWTEPVNITPLIQSDGDQYVTAVSYDGKVLYLTREDNFNSDIWVSYLKDSVWSKSEPLQGEVNTRFWESHATISKDGKTLYFASNMSGGEGGMDIYKSVLSVNKMWGPPANLGKTINTPVNEDTPFITEDGKTLYFSSQGHQGMGGYDLYKSTLASNNQWTKPVNLGYPLSTTDDDLFYYPWHNGKYALMSLYEPDGLGKEDIYEIQEVIPGAPEMTLAEAIEAEQKKAEEKEMLVSEEETKTQQIEIDKESPEEITEDTNIDSIPENLIVEEEEKLEEEISEKPTVEEVQLKVIVLKPVYFDFDSYSLTAEGKDILDSMAILLKQFNDLSLQLLGFSDSMGPAAYNKILSEKRANAALNYLLSKGINSGRLKATGFGETRFAAINSNPDGTDNPEGRKYNRRVEMQLSGSDLDMLEIKHVSVPEELKMK